MRNRKIIILFISAFFIFFVGLIANYYASIYATERASSAVADIILSNIPIFDVDAIFVFGPTIFWIIIASFLLYKPQRIPFTLQALGLLMLTRALFVTLTHIGPFPDHNVVTYNLLGLFSSGGDLFFSGHTAMPFMIALVFWKDIRMRIFCIGSSVFFGIIVLLGHLHYSIDVAAAFFITYTVYHLATIIFKRGKSVLEETGI